MNYAADTGIVSSKSFVTFLSWFPESFLIYSLLNPRKLTFPSHLFVTVIITKLKINAYISWYYLPNSDEIVMHTSNVKCWVLYRK